LTELLLYETIKYKKEVNMILKNGFFLLFGFSLAFLTCDPSNSGSGSGDSTGSEATFNGETLTSSSKEQETRKSDGYDFELWNQNKQGTASMTLGNGGTFKCKWSGIENVLFRAGRKYDKTKTHSQIGVFSIEYNAPVFSITGNVGYLSVYGWVTGGSPDALIEYYIVESRGSYNPGSGGTNKGTVTIDGGTYTIYETTRTNQPSIEGTKTFKQYFSVRNSNRTSGTISVSEHFKAWADKGLTSISNGKLYEVALKVEGYQNSGSAEISKNILSINGTPIK
jgi:endo-1,4-beta-xylanase